MQRRKFRAERKVNEARKNALEDALPDQPRMIEEMPKETKRKRSKSDAPNEDGS